MHTNPKLEQRAAQPYAGINIRVSIPQIGATLPPLMGQIAAWLGSQGIAPAGPPFFRYIIIDMENELEMEVGFPVPTPVQGAGDIHGGTLPAGCYATLLHTGPYEQLMPATEDLLEWASTNGIRWQTFTRGKDEVWAARLEFYISDPAGSDPATWQTELAFLTVEDGK